MTNFFYDYYEIQDWSVSVELSIMVVFFMMDNTMENVHEHAILMPEQTT